MIGLMIAIVTFNFIAFKTNKRLTTNQIVHIWTFTIALQVLFDTFIEFKYHGYWYFNKEIEWMDIFPHTLVVPAANMIFLNWYPFKSKITRQISYFVVFLLAILLYEVATKLPEPLGYFHYGWWRLWHAALINPFLLLIILGYYKWIRILEKMACK
jgi:hypothetical protein